jgi:hypothetical protein
LHFGFWQAIYLFYNHIKRQSGTKVKNEIFEDTVIAQSDIRIHFVGDTGFANNCQ